LPADGRRLFVVRREDDMFLSLASCPGLVLVTRPPRLCELHLAQWRDLSRNWRTAGPKDPNRRSRPKPFWRPKSRW